MESSYSNRTDDQLEIKWNTIKETFVREYSSLSPNELQYTKGEFDELLLRISKKTGMTTSKIRTKILRWDDAWFHFF